MAAIERTALQEEASLVLLKLTVVHGFAANGSPDWSRFLLLLLLKRLLIGSV